MRYAAPAALAAALLLGALPPSSGDNFVLKNGSVVEGKIKAYDPVKKAYVIEVDEKGATRTIKENEIKARFVGRTSWERRADYLVEYEKSKKPNVKPTWDSHQALGKWCKTHLLGDRGVEHYRISRRLRVEKLVADLEAGKLKPEDEIRQRLDLAKWCEKQLGLFDEAREEYRIAYGIKRVHFAGEDDEASADELFSLAKWSEEVGLEDAAVSDYEKILVANPRHGGARTALDRIKNSLEFRLKVFGAEMAKAGRAWSITVTVEENVDKKFLEDWGEKIQHLSEYVWNASEGQFYIAEVEVEDSASDGKIIVEKGKLDWYGMDNKEGMGVLAYCAASGTPRWEIHCPGKSGVSVLAHEMFHGVFGLPDEYYQTPQCECVMRAAPNPQIICTEKSAGHQAPKDGPPGSEGKRDCWDIVMSRPEFKGTPKHPNPTWTWNEGGPDQMGPPKGLKDIRTEGPRNVGGKVRWNGLELLKPPATVIKIVDN